MALTKATLIDLNSNELILDLDADTSITADTDDTIHFKISGSDEITMTAAGLSPASADGNALGTAALEWSDLFLADGGIIYLGADQDVTLTHVHNEGLLLNSTMKLEFNDASQFIQGSSATVLSIGATDEIDLTATAIDINGTCDVSGAFSLAGTAITATAAEINLIDGGATVGTGAIADGDGLLINDAGTMRVATVQTLSAYLDDEITAMPNLVTTAATTVGALDSGSITSGFGAIDNGTSNIRSATITAETAFVPDASGGADLGTTALEFNNLYLNDSGSILFGDDQDTTLVHTDGTGLTLNSTNKLCFNDASQFIQGSSATVLSIGATDEIDLTATTVDLNGTLNVSGVATFQAIPVLPANSIDSAHYVDASIDLAHMSDNSIDSGQYVDGSIDLVHMSANSVDSDQYVDGSIDTAHIANDQITAALIADNAIDSDMYVDGSIDTAHIANDQITAALMADNSIDSDMYVDGSIDLVHMSANSVDSDQYVDGSIDLVHMSANSIDSDQYVDGSIDLVHMSANSIDSDQYVDGSIDTAHIADLNVTSGKLAADCIVAAKIADNAVNSEHITAGAIDNAHIADDQINSEHYADLSIDAGHLALDQRSSGSGDDRYFGNSHDYTFYDASVGISWFTANAEEMRLEDDGDLHVDGDVVAYSTTVSDATLKYNINPIEFALDKVNQLKGVTFNYFKNDKESAGLLAQDVEKVMPSAVSERKIPLHTGDDKAYKTLHYDSIHALLIESIKELTTKLEESTKRIETLENR